jgi:4-hydroxy-tetrahydrodipicolinate synthase
MGDRFRGVFPVFQTPFAADESIDFDQLEAEIEWIARQGVHGIVLGMVSEILKLNDVERHDVILAASATAAAFGLPLIASVGAESTTAALQRIDDAIDSGASALMATPPLLTRNGEKQLESYFRSLLRHSPVALIVQDASAYVGQALSVDLQSRLFQEFGDRVWFKPESVPVKPAIDVLLAATDGGARIFEGMGGAALVETHSSGISGSMPGAEVCWAVVAMWNALERNDIDRAAQISEPLSSMISLQGNLDSFVACEKYLLVEQSVLTSPIARTPVGFELTTQHRVLLSRLLGELREATSPVPVQ